MPESAQQETVTLRSYKILVGPCRFTCRLVIKTPAEGAAVRLAKARHMLTTDRPTSVDAYLRHNLKTKGVLVFPLFDPERTSPSTAAALARTAEREGADAVMIGGSLNVTARHMAAMVTQVKKAVHIPLIIFPQSGASVVPGADALFFMSMLNSRERTFLIDEQRRAAAHIRKLGIEPLAVAYLVVEPGGAVGRVGQASLVRRDDIDGAVGYSLAAEMFGFGYIYLEAGSGAERHVPPAMVQRVKANLQKARLIVGGGIRRPSEARAIVGAGADAIVVGTRLEATGSIKDLIEAARSAA